MEFAKKIHPVEIWNDKLSALDNFYHVCKSHYMLRRLRHELRTSAYSEKNYLKAVELYKKYSKSYPQTAHEKVQFAWATFWMCNCTFSSQILGGYAFSAVRNQAKTYHNKAISFSVRELGERMLHVTMFNRDAIKVYDMFNKPGTMFYADPPYFNSNMGHYSGYTKRDFTRLLWRLSECKGKFVLSSYDSVILQAYIKKHGWFQQIVEQTISASRDKTTRMKGESITTNFDPLHAVCETIPMF